MLEERGLRVERCVSGLTLLRQVWRGCPRRGVHVRAHTLRGLAVLFALLVAIAPTARAGVIAGPITGSLSKAGRWTVDRQGRVVVLHGFDIMRKVAPFYPNLFTEKDARF